MITVTQNTIETLNDGDKITMVIENSMGLTVVRHGRYKSHAIGKYAQYNNCLSFRYVLKGERKTRGNAFTNSSISIAAGWQNIQSQDSGNFDCFDGKTFGAISSNLTDVLYSQVDN
jgi:hypothetical protein